MPKYVTYGDYDEDQNTYTGDTEKEISGASAEDILRGNEEAATENNPETDEQKKDAEKEKKNGLYKKSTAEEANARESRVGEGAGSRFVSQVSGKKGKMKGGRFAKRFAPLAFIVGLVGAGAVGVGVSQVMMPFHVVESLTEMTDGSFTARSARMPKLVKWLFNMKNDTNKTKTVKSLFGNTETTRYRRSVTSNRMRKRLAAEGIDVIDTDDGKTVLRYKDANGADVDVEAKDYTAKYREDADFRNRMNRGGRGFLGRIAAHIDLTLANFLNSHNLTKNLFKKWINKVYDAEGQTARLHDVIEERSPDTKLKRAVSDYDGADEDSDEFKTKVDSDADAGPQKVEAEYGKMISNIASITTSTVCGAAAIASAVTVAKVAIAYENARRAFSGIAESVDKVKAGDGNESPINASADTMMKRDANGLTMLQSESMKWALSDGIYTPDKNADDVKSTDVDSFFRGGIISGITTSANFIMGCAIANITTAAVSMMIDIVGNIIAPGVFSVGKVALTTAIGAGIGIVTSEVVGGLAKMLVNNAKTNFCLDVSGPKAGACMYLGASKYNGQNFQAGGGSLATKGKAEGFYDAYKIALADEAELIRDTKSPFDISSSHTFLGSIVSKLGFLSLEMPSLSSVASSLTNLAKTSFASLFPSASAVEKFSYFSNQLRDDCTNLQFGDIQALGDLNCEPVLITDQSIVNQSDGDNDQSDPEAIFLELQKVGSFEMNGEVLLKQDKNGNITDADDGVEIIKKDSMLAKYISYCGYRNSPFGHIDQNIMNAESQVTDNSRVGSLLGSILNAIPVIGDLVQMSEATNQIATVGWSSGANCIARDDAGDTSVMNVETFDSESDTKPTGVTTINIQSWNNFMRYAQAYVADDRFMQTSYENYVSPVQLFAEKQKLVESDDKLSFVEYLAKYSGYTVENMQVALNELEYWTYIAQYEPEGKGPVIKAEEVEPVYDFSTPEVIEQPEVMIADRFVVYADVRNRYAAMA